MTIFLAVIVGVLGIFGAESAMHETHALSVAMHQVSDSAPGFGVCP